jgi:hypothetical protein
MCGSRWGCFFCTDGIFDNFWANKIKIIPFQMGSQDVETTSGNGSLLRLSRTEIVLYASLFATEIEWAQEIVDGTFGRDRQVFVWTTCAKIVYLGAPAYGNGPDTTQLSVVTKYLQLTPPL